MIESFTKKSTEELSLMALKSDAKFKEKLTRGCNYYVRNLVIFHPTSQKSENSFLMGSFRSKYTRFELQKYRGFIFYDTEQWFKIWINSDIRAFKSLENCTLTCSFCSKHIMLQLESFIGVMYHDTEGW